jgi:hypothetical protein
MFGYLPLIFLASLRVFQFEQKIKKLVTITFKLQLSR